MKNLKMRSLGIGFVFTGALYVVMMILLLITGRDSIGYAVGVFANGIFLLAVGSILYFVGDKENRQRRMEDREHDRLRREEWIRRAGRGRSDKGGAESEWRI